ncbi:CBO0543 family protein [Bacillus salipaludis]|uniref:CBO0543 family protein n=1 Tax=Bacillus salipaludis TaxID=2547811 RepID=UPI003D211E56
MCILDVFIAWRWGDWRNWKKYQSTILYFILGDLLYNFLCYNYSMWEYEPVFLNKSHTIMNLTVMFIGYPCRIFVFLGRYPSGWIKQILWIGLWALVWSLFEWLNVKNGEFSYHNGWTIMCSVFLNFIIYALIRLHYKKPLLTYLLSVLVTAVLLTIFNVPISKMK